MLVLTRRLGESVVISDDIYCTVLGYQNDVVRLAFDAPRSIAIHRDEIQRRIERDRQYDHWYHEKEPNRFHIVDRLIHQFKQNP